MFTKKGLLVVLVASAVMLAVGIGPQVADSAQALSQVKEPNPPGVTVPYAGRLDGEAGQPVAGGAYDFSFVLYDVKTGGEPLWSEVQEGVAVQKGAFNALLGGANGIPMEVLAGGERWLAVGVRGLGEADFTALTPRQRLVASSPAASASPSAGSACPHDHFNEDWVGSAANYGLRIENTSTGDGIRGYANSPSDDYAGLYGYNYSTGPGVLGRSGSGIGVYGEASVADKSGVYGVNDNASGYGVYGTSAGGYGVYGEASAANKGGVYGVNNNASGDGVHGNSTNGRGVYGNSTNGYGVVGTSDSDYGVYGEAWAQYKSGVYGVNNHNGGYGIEGESASGIGVYATSGGNGPNHTALRAYNSNTNHGMAAFFYNKSDYHTTHFQNAGSGGVLYLQNNGAADGSGGGDFITAIDAAATDTQFRVTSAGAGYADGGWNGSADFAELMTTDGPATAYEPGDVLVISAASNRSVALSSQPYSTLVIGIYSEKPGFVGSSHPMDAQQDDEIPVAVVGIVLCKVSAENGPISRGDLLVASSTPGHAMRADHPEPGTILGKALEPLDTGTGVIQILVTLQ